MAEKIHEKIQFLDHFFGPRVYYRVKNKKNLKLQVRICIFYFTGSFFRHRVFYGVNLNN